MGTYTRLVSAALRSGHYPSWEQMLSWRAGDWVVRREVLAQGPWEGTLVRIIEDHEDYLLSYIAEGSPLAFPEGDWPIEGGKHPWSNRDRWQGHGCLMYQPRDEAHAIWHFWRGPKREFACWYINLQDPYRRTEIGYDTQDLELDVLVYPDGRWEVKDDELMDVRVKEGRWTAERVEEIRAQGRQITARLEAGERWWPERLKDWQPNSDWELPHGFPDGWEGVPWETPE